MTSWALLRDVFTNTTGQPLRRSNQQQNNPSGPKQSFSLRTQIKDDHLFLISELRNAAIEVAGYDSRNGVIVSGIVVDRLAHAIDSLLFYACREPMNKSSFDSDNHTDKLNKEGDYWKLLLAAAGNATQPYICSIEPKKFRESLFRITVRRISPPTLKRVFTKRGLCKAWVRSVLTFHDSNNLAMDLGNIFRAFSFEKEALLECYDFVSSSNRNLQHAHSANEITTSPIRKGNRSITPNLLLLDTPLANPDVVDAIIGALAVLHPLTAKNQKLYLSVDHPTLDCDLLKPPQQQPQSNKDSIGETDKYENDDLTLACGDNVKEKEEDVMSSNPVVIEVSLLGRVDELSDSIQGYYFQDGWQNNAPKYLNHHGCEIFLALVTSIQKPMINPISKNDIIQSKNLLKDFISNKTQHHVIMEDEVNFDEGIKENDNNNKHQKEKDKHNKSLVNLDDIKSQVCTFRWYLGCSSNKVVYFSVPTPSIDELKNGMLYPPSKGWIYNNHHTLKMQPSSGNTMELLPPFQPIFHLWKGNKANEIITKLKNENSKKNLEKETQDSFKPDDALIRINDQAWMDSDWPIIQISSPTSANIITVKSRQCPRIISKLVDNDEKSESFEINYIKYKQLHAELEKLIEEIPISSYSDSELYLNSEAFSLSLFDEALNQRQNEFLKLNEIASIRQEKYLTQCKQWNNKYKEIKNKIFIERKKNYNLNDIITKCEQKYINTEIMDQYQIEYENFRLSFEPITLEDVLIETKIKFDEQEQIIQHQKKKEKELKEAAILVAEEEQEKVKINKGKEITYNLTKNNNDNELEKVNTKRMSNSEIPNNLQNKIINYENNNNNDDENDKIENDDEDSDENKVKEEDIKLNDNNLDSVSSTISKLSTSDKPSSSASSSSSSSPLKLKTTSNTKKQEVVSKDPTLLLKKLRDQGRRLIWLPPVQISCELKSVDVLGIEDGLYVLSISRVSIKTTPLIQPDVSGRLQRNVHNNSGYDSSDTEEGEVRSKVGEDNVDDTNKSDFLLEHISRLEVCTVRVSLAQLGNMHALIETSISRIIQAHQYEDEEDDDDDDDGEDVGMDNENDKAEDDDRKEEDKAEEETSHINTMNAMPRALQSTEHEILPPVDNDDDVDTKMLSNNSKKQLKLNQRQKRSSGLEHAISIPGFPAFPHFSEQIVNTKRRSGGFLGFGRNNSNGGGGGGANNTEEGTFTSSLSAYFSSLISLQYSKPILFLMMNDTNSSDNIQQLNNKSHDLNQNRNRTSSRVFEFDNDDFECVRESTSEASSSQQNKSKVSSFSNINKKKSLQIGDIIANHFWGLRCSFNSFNKGSGKHALVQTHDITELIIHHRPSVNSTIHDDGIDDIEEEDDDDDPNQSYIAWGSKVDNDVENDESETPSGYLDISLIVDDEAELERRAEAAGEEVNHQSRSVSRQTSVIKGNNSGGGGSRVGLASRSEEDQLRRQNHRCLGCGVMLSSSLFLRNYAPCRFLDALLCKKYCHKDEHRVIPRRVLHHWDFVPHRVSRAAAAFLDSIHRLPLLDISLLSPSLLSDHPNLKIVRSLRHQLSALRDLSHRAGYKEGLQVLKSELGGRYHLVLDTELYSIKDLEQVNDGKMKPILDSLLDTLSDMVAQSTVCRKWLSEAERGGHNAENARPLRMEEKLLYRSLLGLSN